MAKVATIQKRGPAYKWADFVERSTARKGEGPYRDLFAHSLFTFLKTLDGIQDSNSRVTLALQAGGSLNVVLDGLTFMAFKPATAHLRMILLSTPRPERSSLLKATKSAKGLFKAGIPSTTPGVLQWRCADGELSVLLQFLKELPGNPSGVSAPMKGAHARYIPGAIRQAVLEDFIEGGRICLGVDKLRKPHPVAAGDKIEFDHIAPFAEGGSNGLSNIQILCVECNRIKSKKAL